MKEKKNKAKIAYYALSLAAVLGMLILIYRFSAAPAAESSNLSGGFCDRVVTWFVKIFHLSWKKAQILKMAELIETPVRKCAHFMEYALLGLIFRVHQDALRTLRFLRYRGKLWHGVLFCGAYAISDEIHQYFVPGRACRAFDMGLDTLGAAFGILIADIIIFRFLFKSRKKEVSGAG